MLAVVVSRADSASEHVGEHLLDCREWTERTDDTRPEADGGGTVYRHEPADGAPVELRTFAEMHLELDGVAAAFGDPDLLVFASRHAGDTGPLLTAHHTGNVGPAEFGGAAGELARACPNALRRVLGALDDHAPAGYEVGMECTHHGPSDVGAPSMFVEVGSDEAQWADPAAARAVALAILELAGVDADVPRENGHRRHLAGFGGGHYVPRFERIVRETDWAVGHVAADWGLEVLGDPDDHRAVIERVLRESRADCALVADDRPALEGVLADLDCRVVGEGFLRETTGVSLALVERLEAAIRPVDAGLRLGVPATDADPDADFAVTDLDSDLLGTARGIDADRAREAVDAAALAYATEQSGTQVTNPVAVAGEPARERIVDGLANLLDERFDSVERVDGAVVAREEAFDPELAREAGVPEGPKFGRLSAGKAVEVDGETVEPAAVTRERVRRFES